MQIPARRQHKKPRQKPYVVLKHAAFSFRLHQFGPAVYLPAARLFADGRPVNMAGTSHDYFADGRPAASTMRTASAAISRSLSLSSDR